MPKLSRRRFLQTAAVAATATQLQLHASPEPTTIPWPENGALVPDDGWRLWIDEHAAWQNDDLFLPEDVSWISNTLCAKGQPLPINPPTGGWSALTPTTGLEVLLPTTVEQHLWGKYGAGTDGKPRPSWPTPSAGSPPHRPGTPIFATDAGCPIFATVVSSLRWDVRIQPR